MFEKILKSENHFFQFARYFLVGGSCAVADLAFLYVLVDIFHFWYLYSAGFSFVMVGIFGYFAQKYFTFRNQTKNHKKQLTMFFLVGGLGLLLNTGSMYFWVEIVGLWYLYASAVTKFIVLAWNFSANKWITFKE